MTGGIDEITRLPDGREALIVMQEPPTVLSRRMMCALGAMHWGFPNKAMCDAAGMKLPEWPDGVIMWVITHRSLCALRFPCHDPSPVRPADGYMRSPLPLMDIWECYT